MVLGVGAQGSCSGLSHLGFCLNKARSQSASPAHLKVENGEAVPRLELSPLFIMGQVCRKESSDQKWGPALEPQGSPGLGEQERTMGLQQAVQGGQAGLPGYW